MTTAELEQKKVTIEVNILAVMVYLAHQEQLLVLVKGCLANPSRENMDILASVERQQRDWLVHMASELQTATTVREPT